MPVPTLISELSQTAASNNPPGSESPSTTDDYLRQYAAFIATLRDGKGHSAEVDVASAATTDIGAANSHFVRITGTTTITSFGTNYNGPRFIRFAGALTLTHNASSLILPGAANIATVAGDTAIVVPLAAGWQVVSYQRTAGAPVSADNLGLRNRIINGNFDIWQRGTSFTAAGYGADRWGFIIGTGGAATVSQQAFALGQTDVPGEPSFFFRHNRTTAATAASEPLYQRIESVRSFAGQQVTLQIYAKAAASKTFKLRAQQIFGTGGTPSATVFTAVGDLVLTTAWQRFTYTFTLPSISGKTLGTNGDDFLQIDIFEDAGFSTFTLDVSRVQLELGAVATPFEHRPIGQELALCQRYFEEVGTHIRGIVAAAGGFLGSYVFYKVTKRAPPTLTPVGTTTTNNVSSELRNEIAVDGFRHSLEATSANTDTYIIGRRFLVIAEL